MRKLLLLLILLPILSVCSVAQSIIINEVSPANSFQEENGGNSDWIELYNSSSEAISLKDWAITDNKTQLQKTQLPDYLLGAQEYMLISASGTEPNQQAPISNICNEPPNVINRQSAGIPANFKLKTGETVYLTNPNGQIQDSISIPSLKENFTIGRNSNNGQSVQIFTQSTPCSPNTGETILGFIDKPVEFSVPSGLYNAPISLQLSGAEEGEQIRYTLDGTNPNLTSPVYASAITIEKSTVVRASYFKENFSSLRVTAYSYLFNVNHSLPVISLAVNEKDFFDDTVGIYVPGFQYNPLDIPNTANYYKDIEKPIQVSFFDSDQQSEFHSNAGVKIFGGVSRNRQQRSLSIFFRNRYGSPSLEYPLFNNRNYSSFQAFVLRNNGNDEFTMLRDLTLTSLMEDSNQDIQAGRPVVTYMNSEYWGIYNIREKINEHFLAAKHQVSIKNISLLESLGNAIYGTNDEYTQLIDFVDKNNLSISENYQQVANQIDLPNYLQYNVAQIYFGNTDWPHTNIKFWKHKNGKWRWILFDTDYGFGFYSENFLGILNGYNTNNLSSLFENKRNNLPINPKSTLLFTKLLTNTNFRNGFINTAADELNTRFLSNKVIEKIQANAARIQREMFKHNSKWRRQGQSQWEDRISNMEEFAEKRPAAFRSHIQEQFELPAQREVQINIEDTSKGQVQLNSLLLTTNNWSGIYFESVPVTLTALPKSGYAFDKWSGSTDTTAATIVIDPDQGLALTAHFKKETVLPAVSTVIFNEINYNSSEEKDAGDWIELYNNGPTQQDLSNWVFKDSKDENSFLFPQGTIIDSKGYLVLTGTTSKFEQQFPLVTPVIGEFDFKLSSDGEFIRLYDERNRLVDSLWYLPTDNWPTAANGEGPTLELIDPDTDNTLSSNWTTFPFNGTPSAPNGNYTTATFTLEKENLLTITPNPFSEELTLNFLQNAPELTIQLLDVNGQFIKDLFAKKQYPTQQLTLKIPELTNGLYWLRINIGAQQIVRKIIKH